MWIAYDMEYMLGSKKDDTSSGKCENVKMWTYEHASYGCQNEALSFDYSTYGKLLFFVIWTFFAFLKNQTHFVWNKSPTLLFFLRNHAYPMALINFLTEQKYDLMFLNVKKTVTPQVKEERRRKKTHTHTQRK